MRDRGTRAAKAQAAQRADGSNFPCKLPGNVGALHASCCGMHFAKILFAAAIASTRGFTAQIAAARTTRVRRQTVSRAAPATFTLTTLLVPVALLGAELPPPVTLNWLGETPPTASTGITWGVPWPKGTLTPQTAFRLQTARGQRVEIQSWPLAYWPDGSVKWSGHAIAASPRLAGPFQLAPTSAQEERARPVEIKYAEDSDSVTIDTGSVRARIAKRGAHFIHSLTIGERVVAEQGKLIALREDRSREAEGERRDESFESAIESVTLERSGPVNAVIRITGHHRATATRSATVASPAPASASGSPAATPRSWLPFTVRLQFFAGTGAIKLTHSFVFDGDGNRDFIKGIGLSFTVPFKEEAHNRHLRFAGDAAPEGNGVWLQPVRMLPGYCAQAGATTATLYGAHLAGERIPNLAELDPQTRSNLLTVPLWADAKLTQVGPNNWSLHKRTAPEHSWLHVTDGRRARGLAVLADVSGGLAVGVKDFWQKSAKSFELLGGGSKAGELRVWLWSPEAGAMDLSRYDEIPHGLGINYEDWKPGWGTPLGIANTHDLTLWAFDKIPAPAALSAMADAAAAPPILVCSPQYYHAQQAVGRWSLPDRSTPALRWVEDQIDTLVNYYRDQVDERSWYGFWDFGDIMHNYDFGRHEWRYDVGGWAWVNTELMPDMLLWYAFLRTGRADLFRFAEAMTRHTSEVDVHHLGPFAPLGSRHNVNHWGDGAKQPRISHAGLKRHYYFLTGGDGRIGDLLREQVDADLTYSYLERFNNAHYVPNDDGTPRMDRRAGGPAPRPEDFAPRPAPDTRKPFTRFGLEWMCYALNWTTEWERGLDPAWRPRIEADMKAMAANVDANGRFPGNTFGMLFGGPENLFELEPMYDVPEFWRAWVNTCEATGRQADGSRMTAPRLLAYAAYKKNDAALGRLAWEKLIGQPGALPPLNQPKKYAGPDVLRPVTDPSFIGAPVGWQLHGVASIHWALNAIETLEFAKPWLRDWENAPAAANAASPAAAPATNEP